MLAVAIAAIACVATTEATPITTPSDVIPSIEAQAALAALAVPSAPTALAGSIAVSASTHRFAAGCDAVRAAYQRPGAPVPPGTTVTVAADGGLRFQAPFGPAAAFLRDDADAGCTYQIEASSTIVVAGPDVPNLDDFLTVTCLQPLGIALFAVAEVDVDGQPHTLAFVLNEPVPNPPQERPFMIGFYPGLPIDLLGGSSEPPGAQTFPNLVGTYDPATARGTVSGAGPTGPISGSFQCTVNNLDVPGF